MYTVKQVVAMTGLTAARLRAWERRYGVVSPRRTDAKYRMYGEDDVQRLRTMVQLVESGVATSAAAIIVTSDPRLHDRPGGDEASTAADLAQAAAELDVGRLAGILTRSLSLDGFEMICDGWLTDAVGELDRRRRKDELLDVHVRAAEQAIVLRLGSLYDQAVAAPALWHAQRQSESAPIVLIGQQEGAGRDVVPMLFSVALRRHGVDSRYLGRAISVEGWRQAVHQLRPRAVAIASSTARGRRQARELSAALSHSTPPVQVWLGGPGHDPSEPWVLPMHMLGATHAMLGQLWGGVAPTGSASSASPAQIS